MRLFHHWHKSFLFISTGGGIARVRVYYTMTLQSIQYIRIGKHPKQVNLYCSFIPHFEFCSIYASAHLYIIKTIPVVFLSSYLMEGASGGRQYVQRLFSAFPSIEHASILPAYPFRNHYPGNVLNIRTCFPANSEEGFCDTLQQSTSSAVQYPMETGETELLEVSCLCLSSQQQHRKAFLIALYCHRVSHSP